MTQVETVTCFARLASRSWQAGALIAMVLLGRPAVIAGVIRSR
ncbi:MAG: hypothetical protein ACJ8H8_26515 [Geminicoccaceae bacterium]